MNDHRIVAGRFLMHLGLAVLPPGRSKRELTAIIQAWATNVYAEVWFDLLRREGARAVEQVRIELAAYEARLAREAEDGELEEKALALGRRDA